MSGRGSQPADAVLHRFVGPAPKRLVVPLRIAALLTVPLSAVLLRADVAAAGLLLAVIGGGWMAAVLADRIAWGARAAERGLLDLWLVGSALVRHGECIELSTIRDLRRHEVLFPRRGVEYAGSIAGRNWSLFLNDHADAHALDEALARWVDGRQESPDALSAETQRGAEFIAVLKAQRQALPWWRLPWRVVRAFSAVTWFVVLAHVAVPCVLAGG